MTYLKTTLAGVAAAALALAACSGQQGATGPQGPTGNTGPGGDPGGISVTGSVAGSVKYALGGHTYAAGGVDVTESPDQGIKATTDASGAYELDGLPAGVYTLSFSGADYTGTATATVSVVAGTHPVAVPDVTVVKTNPLVVSLAAAKNANNPVSTGSSAAYPAGFGLPVDLTASAQVNGQAAAGVTYAWSVTAGPSTAASLLSATSGATVTFTTDSLAQLLAGGKVPNFGPPMAGGAPRPGFVAITSNMLTAMTYTVKVTASYVDPATQATWTSSKTISVVPGTMAQGNVNVPVGTVVIANDVHAPDASWTLDASKAPGSTAALQDATTANAWFIPDVAGNYVLTNVYTPTGKPAVTTTLTVHAGAQYNGAYADGNTEGAGATYTSSPCMDCHTGAYGAQADAWTQGGHANFFTGTDHTPESIFQAGISGDIVENGKPFYMASCNKCHTTGFDDATTAVNGGFDDVAAQLKWKFPSTLQPSNWDNLDPKLKALAPVDCESCHGANAMEGFITAAPNSYLDPNAAAAKATFLTPSYSAQLCGRCHDGPPYHDKFPMWAKSGHAETDPTIRGAVDKRAPNLTVTATNLYPDFGAGHCARCHTAQGFVAFTKQLAANPGACDSGTSGVVPLSCYLQPTGFDPVHGTQDKNGNWSETPNLDLTKYLVGLGLISQPSVTVTNANKEPSGAAVPNVVAPQMPGVEPQTCQTCHDPHSTGVRIDDATPALWVGYSVSGAGSGAICVMCHNNRAGQRNDGVTAFPNAVVNGVTVQSVGSVHDGPQADVYWGQNAFFMNGALMPSKHVAVADTCVGCHVAIPDGDASGSITSYPNHTFRVDSKLCASCHSAGVDGAGTIAAYEASMNGLGAAIAQSFQAYVATQPSLVIKGKVATVAFDSTDIASVAGPTAADPVVNTTPLYVSNNLVNVSNTNQVVVTFKAPITNPDAASPATVTSYAIKVTSPLYLNTGTKAAPVVGAAALSASGLYARAFWNVQLLANDHSNSVHNPSFVNAVINNTKAAVLSKPANLAY